MSLSAAVLDAMLANGASAELIVAAVKAAREEDDALAAREREASDVRTAAKREANRLRQQRKRERHATSRVTRRDKAAQSVTPPNDIYSNPPIPPVEAEASTAPRGRSDRGSKIPEDWQPPAIADLPDEAKAMAQRWPASAYRAEAEAFRNYWLGESSAKARKSNWNRAWANRIVAVNSKVVRDAKFSGAVGNGIGKAAARPMNAAELRSAIAFAEDQNDFDRAADLKKQLANVMGWNGPAAAVVANVADHMRARA